MYSISMTNTLGFKNSAFLCRQFSCKYLGLQYLSNKAREDQIFCYSYSCSLGKCGLKGKDMLCVFFYKLSVEKIAQCYMFKNVFMRHLQGRFTYLLLETILSCGSFFFRKTE